MPTITVMVVLGGVLLAGAAIAVAVIVGLSVMGEGPLGPSCGRQLESSAPTARDIVRDIPQGELILKPSCSDSSPSPAAVVLGTTTTDRIVAARPTEAADGRPRSATSPTCARRPRTPSPSRSTRRPFPRLAASLVGGDVTDG